jgi:3-deoxy-D-manno-octulosonic-acid transferase
MLLLYNVFCAFYSLSIRLASVINAKARLWINGRSEQAERLTPSAFSSSKNIWFHCSSLGEFEQGRPLIEALKREYPSYHIILTFFSPSGYEIRKNYDVVEQVLYLPMDGQRNAKKFVGAVKPVLAVFVKYEFWYHYLHELKVNQVPTFLVSAAFRNGQPFFKWYGSFFRNMLYCFSHIFVQEGSSLQLLEHIGIRHASVAGDTRYDRVANIAAKVSRISIVETFTQGCQVLIAGSTWPQDEALLFSMATRFIGNWKLIIAPHEIDIDHIQQILSGFGESAVCYSSAAQDDSILRDKRVLIIDNMGMLASLYSYGTIAFVGGGFNKGGIHNILEPAAFGLPIIIGPVYQKFVEAVSLVKMGLVFPVANKQEFQTIVDKLMNNADVRSECGADLRIFMRQQLGATDLIMNFISMNGYLKN